MKIISTAPTRIGLIGGGTDVNPFASVYGGKVLSLAVNLKHKVTLNPLDNNKIDIKALGKEIRHNLGDKLMYGENKDFDLVYAIINYFKPLFKSGFRLDVEFDGNSSSGLGSSGSAAVAIIGAFNHWLNLNLTRMEIAMLAWRMEVKELGWTGGKQDQLAAAFGGINLLTFGDKDSCRVIPLKLPGLLIDKIKERTLLFYIGGKRHSGTIQEKLASGMSEKDKIKALVALRDSVEEVISALRKPDFQQVGKLLDKAWDLKKRSNPSMVNSRVNDLYDSAKDNGALGGKIMGAGEGGYMFFFCPSDKQQAVIKKLENEDCQLIDFKFDFEGLTVCQK